jgi:hypothetical protein
VPALAVAIQRTLSSIRIWRENFGRRATRARDFLSRNDGQGKQTCYFRCNLESSGSGPYQVRAKLVYLLLGGCRGSAEAPRCPTKKEAIMLYRKSTLSIALTALSISIGAAQAAQDMKYPNFKGQWDRVAGSQASFDPSKPGGRGQQAPLTPEYQAIFEESLADQAKGGQGNNSGHARCLAAGMPFLLAAFRPLEFVVTPDTTYILVGDYDAYRRIFYRRTRLAQGN